MNIDWDYTGWAVHVCLNTSPKPSHNSNTSHDASLNINNHIPMSNQLTAPRPSTWKVLLHPHSRQQGQKYIHEVIGTFLYYAHYVDSTMLPALRSLATQQASPTCNTSKKLVHQFLDYTATNSDAIITYWVSDMILAGQSDAS